MHLRVISFSLSLSPSLRLLSAGTYNTYNADNIDRSDNIDNTDNSLDELLARFDRDRQDVLWHG